MLGILGLPRNEAGASSIRHDVKKRKSVVAEAYRIYKLGDGTPAGKKKREDAAAEFRRDFSWPVHVNSAAARAPYFIGVWDTVRSLGIPLGYRDWELSIWPHRFHDHDLNKHVRYGYHALALDDRRHAFHPTIWNEPTLAQCAKPEENIVQTFEQVWFPGAHADVGGGYADRGLADVTLNWMIERCASAQEPLLLEDKPIVAVKDAGLGKIHDSRSGLWRKIAYRELPRQIVKGKQEPDEKKITPSNMPADLNQSWLNRMSAFFPARYNPGHMDPHPDYRTATEQLTNGSKPPPGPWKAVRP